MPRSKIETTTIGNQLDGLVLLDDSATKEHFFSKAKDYKIIHLSTHANANDSIAPWIAFKNEKLYLNELYTTKNQAELVMLNACNSSLGEMNAGEGVFSLARGFFYSEPIVLCPHYGMLTISLIQKSPPTFIAILKRARLKARRYDKPS
ncbi:CHAT domain-containing protein [Lacinutrix neustonica]|uniref:CHAT domain-containing protein n=1 Tax=Lacinutrix neustonica TaxID=2980107 RepID=A0A9E8N016_9FLAO|nr:CHAT domain-containing protein [Lacinutrix neustonica]WAC03627.1 CHAT domain-containing protein [Lacinutrix neustonica]